MSTVDGHETAFDKAWRAHWAFTTGHSIGDPPPPKLAQAVELLETERRAREALSWEAEQERRKREERASTGGRRVIAEG